MRHLHRAAVLLVATACGAPTPRAIVFDHDTCRQCHMLASDARFGGELVTVRGKILIFDDPGCLADFVREGAVPAEAIHSLWVVDFLADSLVPVEGALFLRSDSLRTPMSHRLAALAPGRGADSLARLLSAERLSWRDVLERVRFPGP